LEPQVAGSIDRRIDAELRRVRLDVPASWRAGRYTTLSAGPFVSLTTTTLEEASDDLLGTRALVAAVTRNSSDNVFDPHRGDLRTLSVQRAGFGGDNHFTRLAGTYTRYMSWHGAVLALNLRTGWVESFGPSREASAADIGIQGVPLEFLFQAGGASTVRGFDTLSLGTRLTTTTVRVEGGTPIAEVDTLEVNAGTVLLIGNVELRLPFPWLGRFHLGSVLFLDAGNAWRDVQEMLDAPFGVRFDEPYESTADMRYSYGAGLRYGTPFGPIRVDIGFPLKRVGRRKWHFGLGHTF
jgi:outer membrane protein insertion porin family